MRRARRTTLVTWLLTMIGYTGALVERSAQALPVGGQEIRIELSGFAFRPGVVTVRASVPLAIMAASESRIPTTSRSARSTGRS